MAIGNRRFDHRRLIIRDSAYWLERAAEARASAEEMSPDYQGKMLEIGKVYDRRGKPSGANGTSRWLVCQQKYS